MGLPLIRIQSTPEGASFLTAHASSLALHREELGEDPVESSYRVSFSPDFG